MSDEDRKWPVPRLCRLDEIKPLFEEFHPYKSVGGTGQAWGCFDGDKPVAGFTWQPPPPGCAKGVAPSCPASVLSLSRMVAIPREDRCWHISKPLKWIMRKGLDRGRWPVLVTFADTGEGHCGNTYICSGWAKDAEVQSKKYVDATGARKSIYSNGQRQRQELSFQRVSTLFRFVHRACAPGKEREWLENNGWREVPTGKMWRSGNQGFRWEKK